MLVGIIPSLVARGQVSVSPLSVGVGLVRTLLRASRLVVVVLLVEMLLVVNSPEANLLELALPIWVLTCRSRRRKWLVQAGLVYGKVSLVKCCVYLRQATEVRLLKQGPVAPPRVLTTLPWWELSLLGRPTMCMSRWLYLVELPLSLQTLVRRRSRLEDTLLMDPLDGI